MKQIRLYVLKVSSNCKDGITSAERFVARKKLLFWCLCCLHKCTITIVVKLSRQVVVLIGIRLERKYSLRASERKMFVMHDTAVENVNDYCLPRSSIGRCWNFTELCSNLLATNHLWKVVRHQNALDFHLLMILANIRLKLMGKVEDWKKGLHCFFSEIATKGKKFSTYLRKALLQGLKLCLFISSKVLES